jgi:hypothetical protein
MTTIPYDCSLVSYRVFGHRNVEMHKPHVHRIPDILISDDVDVALLSGPFPEASITATRPPMMDDSDPILLFRSFQCSDDRNSLSTQNPGSRYTDGSPVSSMCLHKQTAQIFLGTFPI